MAGRVLGDVFVVINPDATGFRQLADVQLRKQLAGFRPNVMLGVDAKEANVALTSLAARIKAMSGRLTELRISANDKPAEATLTRLQARLAVLAKQMSNLTMGADTKKLDAAIADQQAKLAGLRQQMSKLSLSAEDAKAAAKLRDLEAKVAHLREDMKDMPAGVDSRRAAANIVSLDAQIKVLKANANAVRINAERDSFKAQIAASIAEIKRLKQEAADIRLGKNIDMGKLLAAEAALLGIEHTVGELGKKELPVAETAMNVFFASAGRATTASAAGWRLLTGHLTLFGGALNRVLPKMFTSVAVWHLLADAVIETVAVWAPAIIAVTAFGVAGADAAREVYNRMKNVHTVMDVTGKAVPPLSNNFAKLANSVRPEVYQLFGDALVIMNKRGGAFNQVAVQTGKVLDQLAARFVVAVTTGAGVNKFMEHAVEDVRLLGDSIGNFGGIFGAVFRAVPGYAEILLKVGDAITRVLEAFTQLAEPVIAAGLLLHGFFIYGGTAVTLFLAMVGGLVKLTGAFFNFNKAVTLVGLTSLKTFATAIAGSIANIITYSSVMIGMAASEGVAAAATGLLSDALLVLSRVPIMVWVTLVAAAITGLIFVFRSAHSSSQEFVNGLQKSIQNAQLPNLLDTIGSAQEQVAARLVEAQAKLAHTTQYQSGVMFHSGEVSKTVTDAYRTQQGVVRDLQAAHSQLGQQYQLVSTRVGRLSKEYGGQTQALGVLNLAGITTSQLLDKSGAAWDIIKVQVEATTKAYQAMGVQAGQLGNDLDVLGRTETDQYQATQKLNQAWTSFISDVTSTQGSFDTVAQGFSTLSDHTGNLVLHLGKLKATYADASGAISAQGKVASATAAVASAQNALSKLQNSGKATSAQLTAAQSRLAAAQDRLTAAQLGLASAQSQGKAAIDALTPAGIALNQAFTEQIGNIDKLFASWRTAGLANNLFTRGVADAIAPMEKYAVGSKEATAQLVALAQEAGYQGPISLSAMNKYLGITQGQLRNTSGRTRELKDITNQATEQEALLTGSMKAQGAFIANTLIRDIDNAILKYNGVETAARNYGNAVAKGGAQSDAARAARQRLITDIIKSGTAAGDSKNQIAAMITKVLGIPPKKALQIVMTGTGSFSLSQINAKTGKQQQAATGGYINMAGRLMRAAGGYIDLGSGPTADDVPAMLSKGEYVVKASSVSKYGKNTMDAINAGMFAQGGMVGKAAKYAAGGLVAHIDNAIFSGDTSVLTGQYVVNQESKFQASMLAAQLGKMRSALEAAKAAAQAQQSFSVSGFGPVGGDAAANKALARSMFPWPASMWPSYDYLEMREAGYNRFARNPSSGAYGIPQALPPTKMPFAAQAAGGSHAGPQLSWMYSYIRSVYGNPVAAAGHERAFNWYKHGGLVQKLAAGGLVGKYASGGQIPLGKYLPQLKKAQGHEYRNYAGLRKAYLADLGHAKKGSWTSGHRAGIRSELATLTKYQSAEEAAYDNILHHGTARANLSKFATRIKAVARTSRDKDLSHSHPGWSHGLQYWLGVLTHLSEQSVAPVYGGSQAKLLFPTWLGRAKAAQSHEVYDYRGLEGAFKTGLSHARKGTWLYQNRKALGERLYAVAIKQNAEAAAYADLVKHSSGSVADLGGLAGRIRKLGAVAGSEAGSLQPSLLGHLPGGHPGWVKALQAQLKALTSLSANPPFNPPWAPGNLGPSHTAAGGVLTFDRGGLLPPGLHMTWNGTGRAERITPAGAGGGDIHIHLHNEGVIGSQHELQDWLHRGIREIVRIRGGGSAQTAFGRNHPP